MYEYLVRAGHRSSELLVEFKNSASDTGFRDALTAALLPFGVGLTWDGQYLNSNSDSAANQLGNAFVESDQWNFVWGHSFGQNNKVYVAALDQALASSGAFIKVG